jgi:MYXO-CTERM domain-containing protein
MGAHRQVMGQAICAMAGAAFAVAHLLAKPQSALGQAFVQSGVRVVPASPVRPRGGCAHEDSPADGASQARAGAAALAAFAFFGLRRRNASRLPRQGFVGQGGPSTCARPFPRGQPQQIPVVDFDGILLSKETLQMRTPIKDTGNYMVHQHYCVWWYNNRKVFDWAPWRSEAGRQFKKGAGRITKTPQYGITGSRKPRPQKGSGRARLGSLLSPMMKQGGFTKKVPHGLDSKKKKVNNFYTHAYSISIVLQSKHRCMTIVDDLEAAMPEPRQKKLEAAMRRWNIEPGYKPVLFISRQKPCRESSLYMAGRLIPKVRFACPRDIDPDGPQALEDLLRARRLVVSRGAFHDLKAKYGLGTGWVWQSPTEILADNCAELREEFPTTREAQLECVKELPATPIERVHWARKKREESGKAYPTMFAFGKPVYP